MHDDRASATGAKVYATRAWHTGTMSTHPSEDKIVPARPFDTVTGAAVDPLLFAQLVEAFYQDLRGLARRERYRLGAGHTLCTTAVVSETWLKLRSARGWNDSTHFLRMAAMAIRQVLVNDARARLSMKRAPGGTALPIEALPESAEPAIDGQDPDLLALDEVLKELDRLSPRQAQVVECRYFAGLSEAETAQALGVNERTVRRDWLKARAWLYQRLAAPAAVDEHS